MSKNKKTLSKSEGGSNIIEVIKQHDGLEVGIQFECKNHNLANKMIELGFWKWKL